MSLAGDAGAQALAEVVRREWSKVVATLVRVTGDLSLAEDAAQDAAVQALASWETNPPNQPTAWILAVARRRAIDRIRREANGRRKAELLARLSTWDAPEVQDPAHTISGLETNLNDDQLRLIFGCCHPALSIEAQAALTLRSVAGLTTQEIARSFLVTERTMAQRLVRAKRKIATAGIPFVLPPDSELLSRLGTVHHVLYLVFNEGYAASGGNEFVRGELCHEAIRLADLLVTLVPDDAETLGLLSLMVSTNARSAARVRDDGLPVLLGDQDRSRWDRASIDEARSHLDRSLRLQRGGPLQVQAAISMLHCDAATSDATDWQQITLLYERLFELTPTPIVELNRAVAVAMHDGPDAGLTMLDEENLLRALDSYRYFHAARADLLARLGRDAEAAAAYDRAIALDGPIPETTLLKNKQAALAISTPPSH